MIHNDMSSTKYWQNHVDTARMTLLFICNIWMIFLGIIVGMVASAVIYFAYHAIADGEQYQAYSEFYLDFATDETGEVYQYYNGYTWNDLMTTDLIAVNTLNSLNESNVDLPRLENATRAEIKSDIRVLRVTITEGDLATCSDIQQATEKSLVLLGTTAKEFNDISVIKSVDPKRLYADNRIFQALELGAIVGFIISILFMWGLYILDDKVMTPTDLYGLGNILGVTFTKSDERLSESLNNLLESGKKVRQSNMAADVDYESVIKLNAGEWDKTDGIPAAVKELNSGDLVIVEVPYRKVKLTALLFITEALKQADISVLGYVIKDADVNFYKMYYGLNGLHRK